MYRLALLHINGHVKGGDGMKLMQQSADLFPLFYTIVYYSTVYIPILYTIIYYQLYIFLSPTLSYTINCIYSYLLHYHILFNCIYYLVQFSTFLLRKLNNLSSKR